MKKRINLTRSQLMDVRVHIEAVAWGALDWADALAYLTRLFPGSYAYIVSSDMFTGRITSFAHSHCCRDVAKAYVDDHAEHSPWLKKIWGQQNGNIYLSEKFAISRAWQQAGEYSEFINKHLGLISGAGLRLDVMPGEKRAICLIYPLNHSDHYDAPAKFLLGTMAPLLHQYMELQSQVNAFSKKLRSEASRVARGDEATVIVNARMEIVSRNTVALTDVALRTLFNSESSHVNFKDALLSAKVLHVIQALCRSPGLAGKKIGHISHSHHWIISFTKVLDRPLSSNNQDEMLICMTITDARAQPSSLMLDEFADTYRLTSSEARLCAALAGGRPLSTAASSTGISYEHARQRLKVIFHKTGTSAQSELCVLLAKFCR